MVKRIAELFRRHWDIISYLVFGVLTTLVNYAVYLPLFNLLGLSAGISNGIAWLVSVLFAFVTNKPFVFGSHDWSAGTVLPELGKFVSCRVGSGLLETAVLLVMVDWLQCSGNVWKLVMSVVVVILNYIGSKLLVFRKK